MQINPIPLVIPEDGKLQKASSQEASLPFGNFFNDALKEVNQLQVDSAEITKKMVLGEVEDIHQVMIAAEKASLALNLTMQIRNKLVEAYQEISRMQF